MIIIRYRKDEIEAQLNRLIEDGAEFNVSAFKKMMLSFNISHAKLIDTRGRNNYDYLAYIRLKDSEFDLVQFYFNYKDITAINCGDGYNNIEITLENK